MQNLQTIKHPQFGQLSVIVIDGREMFKARECAVMLGYSNINDAISRHCKGVVKHDLLTKGGKQAVSLIPEGDLWRLIIRSKLPQAEAIEKWIMEDVLPSIRKTGTYSTNKSDPKQLEFYEYFDKTYNGNPVLTATDIEVLCKLPKSTVSPYAKKYLKKDSEYYILTGSELRAWKNENPKVPKLSSAVTIITKSGFDKICRYYNLTVETPKLFIEAKVEKTEKKKTEYCLIRNNNFAQEEIERIKKYLVAVNVAVDRCNMHNLEVEEMAVRRKCLDELTRELQGRVGILAHMKLSTTTEYKF